MSSRRFWKAFPTNGIVMRNVPPAEAGSPLLLERLKRKAQHRDRHRCDAQYPAEIVELHAVVGRWRMMDPEQNHQDEHRCPDSRLLQVEHHIDNGDDDKGPRNLIGVAAK